MSNIEMWNLIIGFILPPIMAFLVQENWSDQLRAIAAFGVSVGAAAVQIIIEANGWNWHDWIHSSLMIFVAAIAFYKGFWIKAVPATHNGGASNSNVRGGR